MAYTKEVTVDTEVEVDIEFEDLIEYIKEEGLSKNEVKLLAQAIAKSQDHKQVVSFSNAPTIMDELAAKELKEMLRIHGAEILLSMIKAGQGVRV